MEETKPRSNSGYYGDQGNQGTCYAHATTRMIARLIKVIFSPFFNQGEKCSELYVTDEDISNIYSKHGTWDKCKDEMLSALLFRLIYQIIVDKYLCKGGFTEDSVDFVFSTFVQIFKMNYKESLTYVKDKIQFNEIISKIQDEQFHIENLLKLIISIICVFVNFTNLKIINLKIYKINNGSLDPLIKVLKKGYYAVIAATNHGMTITGYKKNFYGRIDLIIKNSWGENYKGFSNVNDNGVSKNFKFKENEYIVYIDPTITFNGDFVSYLKENVYGMLKQISDNDTFTEPEKIVIGDLGLGPIVVNNYNNQETDSETNSDRDSYSSEENEPDKTAPDKHLPYDVRSTIATPKKGLFSRLSRSVSKAASRVGRALYIGSAGRTRKKNKRRTKRRKRK